MYELLILLVFLIVLLVALSIRYVTQGQWFQKAKLGDLLVKLELSEEQKEIIELADEAEKLKANLINSNHFEGLIKAEPFEVDEEPLNQTGLDLSVGEYMAQRTFNQSENSNVVTLTERKR